MKKYVLGFAFNEDRTQVALIMKLRPVWQANKLNGIGGKIEAGEKPHAALVREFREEAGVSTAQTEWQLFALMEGSDFAVYTMRAELDPARFGQLRTCTDETVVTIPLDSPQLHKYAIPNLHWLIAAALDPDAGRMVLRAQYGAEGEDLSDSLLNDFEEA